MRLAAAQAVSVPGDLEANVAAAVRLAGDAADSGARVVVLPELFLTGYDPASWTLRDCLDERPENDLRLAPLTAAARARGLVVVAGAAVRRAAGPTISVLVIDADRVAMAYDKQHVTDEERAFFVPGTHGASLVVDGCELGLGVCFDGCFPEHAAAAATDGAVAYLCPSAYYVGAEHRRDLYYAARALDNGIYVVFSGLTGTCGSSVFGGGSAVYDPEGRPLARLDQDEGVAVADLDLTEVVRVQSMNPITRDRLADLGRRQRLVLR